MCVVVVALKKKKKKGSQGASLVWSVGVHSGRCGRFGVSGEGKSGFSGNHNHSKPEPRWTSEDAKVKTKTAVSVPLAAPRHFAL
jgi:hypothetical protein